MRSVALVALASLLLSPFAVRRVRDIMAGVDAPLDRAVALARANDRQ